MRARVPASTSNLGPGFDVLGLALNLYVEVSVKDAEEFVLTSEGEGRELLCDESHLAAKVVREVRGHSNVAIHVNSEIPLGRGLGSSAALVAAAAAAAGANDPLGVAAAFDGHAENAAASVLGGLVAATMVDGRPVARRLPFDEELAFVVLVPEHELATKRARGVLPEQVPFGDAVFNLGRMGLLLAGLADRTALTAAAGCDRLHQAPRAGLYPEAEELMSALRTAGAVVACWSGAGPSILGICTSSIVADRVEEAGVDALKRVGIAGSALQLRPDVEGIIIRQS